MNHLDESLHHEFASLEVGNHAVAQWARSANVLMSFLIHHLSLTADGNHLVGATIKGNDLRLVNHNLTIADDDCVGRSKVHCNFLGK